MAYDQELLQDILRELREIRRLLTPQDDIQVIPEPGMSLSPEQMKNLVASVQRALIKQAKRNRKENPD